MLLSYVYYPKHSVSIFIEDGCNIDKKNDFFYNVCQKRLFGNVYSGWKIETEEEI